LRTARDGRPRGGAETLPGQVAVLEREKAELSEGLSPEERESGIREISDMLQEAIKELRKD
jgi:hypothetical protein